MPRRAHILVVCVLFALACDSSGTGQSGPTPDAADDGGSSTDGAASDDARFACGDASCDPTQVCLTPAYGCLSFPPDDAGTCPTGTAPTDAGNSCVQSPPAPSCVSPTPDMGPFDCSGADAGATCNVVQAPIPATCNRMCRAICL